MSLDILTIDADKALLKKNKLVIAAGMMIAAALAMLFAVTEQPLYIVLILAFALASAAAFSFDLSYLLFFVLVLGPTMLFLHVSVLYTPFLLLSFLINYRYYKKEDIYLPVLPSIIIYILSCIPSFFNTPELFLSIRDSYNLAAFVIVIIVSFIAVDTEKRIMLLFKAFLTGMTIHSVIVILQNFLTGKRSFGLMAVFYIDFAALAAIYCLIFFFYKGGYRKVFWLALFSINLFGLILTQTRNAWISFGFGALTLMLYLFFKNKEYKLNKRLIMGTLAVFALIVIVAYFTALSVNPKISERFDIQGKDINTERLTDVFGKNSLASRALIWYTAYNAFTVHPVFGIGAYSFKHTSSYYYTIPDDLYKFFVAGKTPHLTYIEVITETGLFGLFFFLIFLITLVRFTIKFLKQKKDTEDGMRTLLINWTFIYIVFSMFMTEAWLYGQFLMWFGILIGLASRNYLIIQKKNEER